MHEIKICADDMVYMEKETRAKIISLATGLLVAFSMIYTAEKIGLVYTMGEASVSAKESVVVRVCYHFF